MRTLGCIGFLFAAGLFLLALALAARSRSDAVAISREPAPAPVSVTLPPAMTSEARAVSAKIELPAPADLAAPVIPSGLDRRAVPLGAGEDLRRLMDVSLPVHDYFATAERLGGFDLGPRQVAPPSEAVGARRTFQTADGPRQADLVYLTDAMAYWVETGLGLDPEAIMAAAQMLESRYLPPLQSAFGREWSPGVDGDPRVTVLHVLGAPDDFELGYFSDENEFPSSLFIHSNEREMVYLNMSRLQVGTDLYLGTLVHELQHLSQWNMDPNEAVWMNEGLSQLAETMAGLDTVDASPYLEEPHIRLDRWSTGPGEVYAHYAGSYLYLLYLRQRAGEAAVRELVRHPGNGLTAVSAVLDGYLPGIGLPEFSMDWAVANYLDNQGAPSPYGYDTVNAREPALATRARRLPFSTLNELDQMAADYIDLDLAGPVRLTFVGDTVAPLVDGPPPSGDQFWYTALGNSSAPSLATTLDLAGVIDPSLTFDLWYDLEPGWDFAYVSVSADGGTSWQVLPGQYSRSGQFGPGWNGRSVDVEGNQSGWIREEVSLAPFAGQVLQVRTDVLSDFEGPSRGFAVANGKLTGAAAPQPVTWQPQGFVETGWLLPQVWGVRVIREGEAFDVTEMVPDEAGMAQLEVTLGPEGGAIVVMPLTAPVAQPAHYWLSVESAAGLSGD